jgi:GAF domain-containing protein
LRIRCRELTLTQQPMDPLRALAELVHVKLGETDLDGLCGRAAEVAWKTIAGADEVSITVIQEQQSRTAAATGDRAHRLDEIQQKPSGGPGVPAATDNATVLVRDIAREERWAPWVAYATGTGIRSALSLGLPIHATVQGSLTFYSETLDAFDDAAVELAQTFADYAAVALANAYLYDTTADLAEHMRKAMENRAVIEQAKGIVMSERRCTADEAFAVLNKMSQDTNRKLRDVAAAVVARSSEPVDVSPGQGQARRHTGRSG